MFILRLSFHRTMPAMQAIRPLFNSLVNRNFSINFLPSVGGGGLNSLFGGGGYGSPFGGGGGLNSLFGGGGYGSPFGGGGFPGSFGFPGSYGSSGSGGYGLPGSFGYPTNFGLY